MYTNLLPVDITVESITGERWMERVRLYETVGELKNLIWRRKGIPASRQALVLSGRALPNDYELDRAGVNVGCVLKLIVITRAGPSTSREVVAASERAIWSDETSDKEKRSSFRRGLSAPEDTSAKESSAGETEKEMEEGKRETGSGTGEEKQMVVRVQKAQQTRRQRTLSLNHTSTITRNDESNEPDLSCSSSSAAVAASADCSSAGNTMMPSIRSLSSPAEDPSEDASEFSSGMIICDLSNEFRKLKVRRHRHQNQPSLNRIRPRSRPRAETRAAEVTSSDDNELSAREDIAAQSLLADRLSLARRGLGSSRFMRYSLSSGRSNGSTGSVRCSVCAFKMNINSVFNCRCGKMLCSRHRSTQSHACSKMRTKMQQVSD